MSEIFKIIGIFNGRREVLGEALGPDFDPSPEARCILASLGPRDLATDDFNLPAYVRVEDLKP